MRIAHFTDIHITRKPPAAFWKCLFSKRILGWLNLTVLGRQRVFADAGQVIEAFLADLETISPDHVVCTGDLTGLAFREEFEEARRLLAPLIGRPDVTGIPGNHDVYVRSAVRERLYESSFGPWARTDLAADDFPPPHRELHPYPLVRFLDERTVLVLLHDVRPNAWHDSTGRVGSRQLAALDAILSDGRLDRRAKILALHTGYLRADGSRDGRLHALRDARELVAVAERHRVSLLIHGHTHRRFVLQPGAATPVAVANPGSLTSGRHGRAYHLYSVGEDGIQVEARRLDPTTGRFTAWPEATVRLRPAG